MTDSWRCDTCDRCFGNTKNRIELVRKIRNGADKYEYIPYRDMCTDCELYDKKIAKKRRRTTGN